MGNQSLSSSRLKVARAKRHLHDIAKVLKGLEHGRCELVPEIQQNPNIGVLRIRLSPKPPEELSLVVGDCLFNLRSALDHLVWQLVLSNKGTPTDRHLFPISKNREAFNDAVTKHHRLDCVPAEAATIIERLQPYHTGETHPLALLSKLHNIDKH